MRVFLGTLCFWFGALGSIATTIIIVEDAKACFRRVLAGKRIARRFVRRSLLCERVEDCQAECGEEKQFVCEGFNYRLDPTGRGRGECELLDLPLNRLDIGRDVYPDPEYDYYEKDRNAATTNCQPQPDYPDQRYHSRPRPYDPYGSDRRVGYDPRPSYGHDYNRRPPPPPNYDRRPHYGHDYDNRRPSLPPPEYDRWQGGYDRPGDHPHRIPTGYIDRNDDHNRGIYYLPPNPSPTYPKTYYYGGHKRPTTDVYKPYSTIPTYPNRNRYNSEGKHHYLPPKVGGTKDWGKYGGTYGNFGYGYGQNTNRFLPNPSYYYYGTDNRRNDVHAGKPYLPVLPPKPPSYLPTPTLEINLVHQGPNIYDIGENLILPAEPRYPGYNYLTEECSLRSATGFKLSKTIVKKFYAVPNIYECELLCFKERSFRCSSYAFRYTISLSAPSDNCYLSNKNHKELNYYTDLQPDRDFDIYTMNNLNKCPAPEPASREDSECFWRVRSGLKLDRRVVKETINAKNIVDCQLECLKSLRFTCRAFSFRFGSRPGHTIDNCQLTDWPFYELDPKIDFMPGPGFEIYERGSFGHGCEPYHFGIRGKPQKKPVAEADQLCYVGFGSPARLLPQATRKGLKVRDELDCKKECSKLRVGTLFQCMSFSFSSRSHGVSNCFLSDIHQRDLLPHLDYVYDTDSWLFAWDNYNPQCVELGYQPSHGGPSNHLGREELEGRYPHIGYHTALDTWRAYSVSGWPCKRGHYCQENREAGFWFCKLEGGDADSWDYCCRPDHQCGYSSGFNYPWCYVGPDKTQWRKCSDRYYPYIHNLIDRLDYGHHDKKPYLPPPSSWVPDYEQRPPPLRPPPPIRPGLRPDRPPAPPHERPPSPSLDEYEMQFDEQFLAPPKPGGFGRPRHWPLSYLHKDMPPNITDSESRLMKSDAENPKLNAIQRLIDLINTNDLQNIQYQITNQTENMNDVLFVKIPLPTNFTVEDKSGNLEADKGELKLEAVDVVDDEKNSTKRDEKSLDIFPGVTQKEEIRNLVPVYRKSYITRTNVTSHGRRSSQND